MQPRVKLAFESGGYTVLVGKHDRFIGRVRRYGSRWASFPVRGAGIMQHRTRKDAIAALRALPPSTKGERE